MPNSLRCIKFDNNTLYLLDQRILPTQTKWIAHTTHDQVAESIQNMTVRGAPAIGIAAAYGMALAAINRANWNQARKTLAESRPTAVNLFWALDRLDALTDKSPASVLAEAQAIETEDIAMNHQIGAHGATLVPQNATILTICNTGSLATGGHGTALGIIRTAHQQGKVKHVYSCETRPRQQGLRLTAYELLHDQIPFHSIADSAAASLMHAGKIDFVVAGADRITANGDTANKIGTYMLAVLAHHHKIPFVIAAPSSTLDPNLSNGDLIPIEERDPSELTHAEHLQIAPDHCPVYNPAFDFTPGNLITAIVTEKGILNPPFNIK